MLPVDFSDRIEVLYSILLGVLISVELHSPTYAVAFSLVV